MFGGCSSGGEIVLYQKKKSETSTLFSMRGETRRARFRVTEICPPPVPPTHPQLFILLVRRSRRRKIFLAKINSQKRSFENFSSHLTYSRLGKIVFTFSICCLDGPFARSVGIQGRGRLNLNLVTRVYKV